ncbi:hypothetical protein [Macrococcus lamae]|uniref:DUF5082 domain-containing protein n=1 Tax=Macrococcus lamae TaxID=198484 RepID=A0A4R6BSV3_9STAP|nr:hypothetical protein [Macrococcus lamae]TDM05312.1 hypothetical protein ERX29_10100 [Macrococcus lamae]
MKRLKSYLNQTVKKSIRQSLYIKLKELQQKMTDLNVLKALKSKEHERLIEVYDSQQFKLTVIDSEDGSTRDFRSNRYATLNALNQIDDELREIEASLQMIEHMKEETQYEIMMIRKLKGKEVST